MKRIALMAVALVTTGCTAPTVTGIRYTWTPCDERFQGAVRMCMLKSSANAIAQTGLVVVPLIYGAGEPNWKENLETCMRDQGYRQVDGTVKWRTAPRDPHLKGDFWYGTAAAWPWPDSPPKSQAAWAGVHYYDSVCEP